MCTKSSKSLRDKIARNLLTLPKSGIREFFDLVSSRPNVISLGVGEPDFDAPWHIRESTIFSLEKGATSYTSNHGLLKLRQAISRYVEKNFSISYDPETEMLITVGVSEALDLAVRAIVEPGDEIILHQPSYVSYAPVVQLSHGVPVIVHTSRENGFKLSADRLKSCITDKSKAVILNFPNNPTGAIMTREDLEPLARVIQDRDLLVITDDIYAELTYEGNHVSIASLPGMRERTIFLHGFSKAWAMTGYRLGYACAPSELADAMVKIHQYTILCAPTPSQEAAMTAITDSDDDVKEMKSTYSKRRNFMVRSFEEMGIPCMKPGGAFYTFPYIGDTGLSSEEFAFQLLEKENVAAVPGTAFGAQGEGHLRCSFSTSLPNIKEAIVRISRFISQLNV